MVILSVLGLIVLIFGIVMLFLYPSLPKQDIRNNGNLVERKAHPFLLLFTKNISIVTISIGTFLFLSVWLFFYANQGYQYYLISPLGTKRVVFDQGFHLRYFSRVQEWEKYVDVKGVAVDSLGTPIENYDGIEGPIFGGVPIRYIDQVTAFVFPYVRIQMPTDEIAFINLAEEFKTPQNLITNTLVPTVREQIINTGYMYSAEDYVSGNASNFRQDIDDQLKNGGFAVDKKEYKDTIVSSIQESDKPREIREIKTRYEVRKRLDSNKMPIRISHDITRNKLIISQVIVDKVDLEPKFRDKLETQRDISAQKRIELQKVETAIASQQRIIAEGESAKADERVKQELEQVKVLIAIETDKKKEETKRELAEIALKTQKLESEKLRVQKDAEAYANRQLVNAGLTPQEKAQFQIDMAVGVAEQLATLKLPEIYINGANNGGKSGSILEELIGAELAKKMLNPEVK